MNELLVPKEWEYETCEEAGDVPDDGGAVLMLAGTVSVTPYTQQVRNI
jgi:hypothetical protein